MLEPIGQVMDRLGVQFTRCSASLTVKKPTVECSWCDDRELVLEQQGESWVGRPCQCKEQKAIKRMLKTSGLTAAQLSTRMVDFIPTQQTMAMYHKAQRYLDAYPELCRRDIANKGLALFGTVGIGKTMLAIAIANELLQQRVPVVFVNTPDLMAELRMSQAGMGLELEKKIELLMTVPVCIFDDVAREKCSEWVQTQYYRVMDRRLRLQLPTIFTSNYKLEEITNRLNQAISSRIYALTESWQIYVAADDYRVYGGKGRCQAIAANNRNHPARPDALAGIHGL